MARGVWDGGFGSGGFAGFAALQGLQDLDISDFSMAGSGFQAAVPPLAALSRLCLGGWDETSDLAPHWLPALRAPHLRVLAFKMQDNQAHVAATADWLCACLRASRALRDVRVPAAVLREVARRGEASLRRPRLRLLAAQALRLPAPKAASDPGWEGDQDGGEFEGAVD